MPIVIYGPQGCGKSTHKQAIASHFERTVIFDDGDHIPLMAQPGFTFPPSSIVFTNAKTKGSIDYASLAKSLQLRSA